jgi:predicted HTH domain antitoxin
MKNLTLEIPDTIEVEKSEILMLLASKFYEQGRLSLGQAAEFAGLSKRTFAELLGKYNVSIFNYSADELAEDVRNA